MTILRNPYNMGKRKGINHAVRMARSEIIVSIDSDVTFPTVMCLSGCLTAYRRHVLMQLEPILENRNLLGIPIKYGEDRFLTRQIVKSGYRGSRPPRRCASPKRWST